MASGSGFDDAFDVGSRVTVLPSEVTLQVVGQADQAAANAAATLFVTADTFDEVVAGLADVAIGDTLEVGPAATAVSVSAFVDDVSGGSPTLWVAPQTWREVTQAANPAGLPPEGQVAVLVVEPADGVALTDLAERVEVAADVAAVEVEAAIDALPASPSRHAVAVAAGALVVGGALALGFVALSPAELPVQLEPARGLQLPVRTLVTALAGALLTLRRILRVDPARAIA